MTTYAGPPVFPQYFVDPLGKPLRSVKITVYGRGTDTKPDLYADREKSTPLGNPFWATSLGNAEFRVDAVGEFEAEVNGVRIPFTVVADPEEPVAAADLAEAVAELELVDSETLTSGLATRAPSTGISQGAVTDLVDDLAARALGVDVNALAAATATALAGKAPSTGIAQSAVTNLVSDLASKATPAQIDAAIAALSGTYAKPATTGTLAARPAASVVGQRYLANNVYGGTQYESLDGATWTQMGPGVTEPTAKAAALALVLGG